MIEQKFPFVKENIKKPLLTATKSFNRRISFREGKYKEAIADCDEIIQQTDLPGLCLRESVYSKIGDYDKVIADFDHVIRLNPNKSAYSLRGDAYMEKRVYTNALADFNEAIRLDPIDFGSYYERGNVFVAMGDS